MNTIKKRIGIIGGGQLGKMMILEAKRLGFYVAVLDPAADCPAGSVCDEFISAEFERQGGYFELAKKVDVITYEFENINADALEILEKEGHKVYPSVKSLKAIQNKFTQKSVLHQNGVPVPKFSKTFTNEFGKPLMFKSSTGGYDGKGNRVVYEQSEVPACADGFYEEFVDFESEISVIACRGIDGSKVVYPVAENIHINSILDTTIVPARTDESVIKKAQTIADKVMEIFEGVGTFCVEMFVTKTGEILVNEVAPRPHNSGHYTIEGCFANQFENHIRAIVGLPLGDVRLITPAVMVNLLGESDGEACLTGLGEAYHDPLNSRLHVHFYGKSMSKIGRKMGHFTVIDEKPERAIELAEKIKSIVKVVGV